MKQIIMGDCLAQSVFNLSDPDAPNEAEFEHTVARALSCAYPDYSCVVFGGRFRYDDRFFKPDLALVANDFSHWFIIEVELVSHSLKDHVLPQVKAFRYGVPQSDSVAILSRELRVSQEQAKSLLLHVPRATAVVANRFDQIWQITLRAHDIQLITVSSFTAGSRAEVFEIEGALEVLEENLGFGTYSAVDRSLRFPKLVKLPDGPIQIGDPVGVPAVWIVKRDERFAWITKEAGVADILDGSYVQLIRAVGGRISLRRPSRI